MFNRYKHFNIGKTENIVKYISYELLTLLWFYIRHVLLYMSSLLKSSIFIKIYKNILQLVGLKTETNSNSVYQIKR